MKTLISILIAVLFIIPYCYAGDICTGLQGWWKFDEGAGTSATADSSVNNYTGTLESSPTWVTGKIGPFALSFNGSSQYVLIGNKTNINFTTGSFSYSGWFKGSTLNSQLVNFRALGGAGYDMVNGLASVAGSSVCRISDGTNTAQSTTWTGTNDSNWHQFICVVDRVAQTLTLYGDGAAIGSTVSTNAVGSVTNTTGFEIAARAGGSFFGGSMDDIRIYNRALSSSDASALFNYTSGACGNIPEEVRIGQARIGQAALHHL